MTYILGFFFQAIFIGSIYCLLELSLSIFQGRSFQKKYALALWMIVYSSTMIGTDVVGKISDAWNYGNIELAQVLKEQEKREKEERKQALLLEKVPSEKTL